MKEFKKELREIAATLGTTTITGEEVRGASLFETLLNSLYLDWAKDRVLNQSYAENVFELSELVPLIADDDEFVDPRIIENMDKLNDGIFGDSLIIPPTEYNLYTATGKLCNWFRHMIDEFNYNRLSEEDFIKAIRTVNIYQNVLMGLSNGLFDYQHMNDCDEICPYYGFEKIDSCEDDEDDDDDRIKTFDIHFMHDDDLLWTAAFTDVNGASKIIGKEFVVDPEDECTPFHDLLSFIQSTVREEARAELFGHEDDDEEIIFDPVASQKEGKRYNKLDDVVKSLSDEMIDAMIAWLKYMHYYTK